MDSTTVAPAPEHVVPQPRHRERSAHVRRPRWALAVIAFSTAMAALWAGAAILTAGSGFDYGDEGFYLLTYRWWTSSDRNFTATQYVYGPVFQLLDYNIAGLRLFRLATVVGSYGVFGWTFMRWLRLRRPNAPASRLWDVAGTAAILAAGGAVYSRLPLTPGYNDAVLLGSVLAMALVLRAATYAERGVPVPAWVPVAWAVPVLAMLMAKWTSVTAVLLIAVAALVALSARPFREVARVIGWALAGLAVTAASVHLVLVPLNVLLPQLLQVNRILSRRTGAVEPLLTKYWVTTVDLVDTTVDRHWPLLVAGAVAVLARGPVARCVAWGLAGLALSWSVWQALDSGGLGGGTVNFQRYPVTLLAAVLFALVTAVAAVLSAPAGRPLDRADGRMPAEAASLDQETARGWFMLATLLMLPMVQGIGTGNPLYVVAFNAFGVWMALLVAVATGIQAAPAPARVLTAAVAAAALMATASIATGGLWRNPYGTVGRAQATERVPGVPALASIKVDPASAEHYRQLYDLLRPYVEPEGRAIITYDGMAGIVLLLGGRHVGEPWHSNRDRVRTAVGIRAECADGTPWWGSRLPVILFSRPASATELRTLRYCGIDFVRDYRRLGTEEQTRWISVYVPRAEPVGR